MSAYIAALLASPDFWMGVLAAYGFLGFVGGLTGVVILVWLCIAVRS